MRVIRLPQIGRVQSLSRTISRTVSLYSPKTKRQKQKKGRRSVHHAAGDAIAAEPGYQSGAGVRQPK